MKLTLAVDFGSTFTKVAAFDIEKEELVTTTQAHTTVKEGIDVGLNRALEQLDKNLSGRSYTTERTFACSSAAGGLRMVAIGLTKSLTTKAAEQAALGAGAKLIATYSHRLCPWDVKEIKAQSPDLILLSGGTDGGDEKTVLYNARMLAHSNLEAPTVVAGNKTVTPKAVTILKKAGKHAVQTANILPELDRLDIAPARESIRNIFIDHITRAKGLDKTRDLLSNIIMPTPMAVLKGAELLSKGSSDEKGLGDLLLVDVGGATTDIHSLGCGLPSHSDVVLKGLSEPYAKRTVEGDLGIRYNARSILEKVKEKEISKKIAYWDKAINLADVHIENYIEHISRQVDYIPGERSESLIDIAMAATAVEIAVKRHVGRIEEKYFPTGQVRVQYGKDLTTVPTLVGTGGVLIQSANPSWILKSACFDKTAPKFLSPTAPRFLLDKRYILFAAGLIGEMWPEKSVRIIKKNLTPVTSLEV